MPDREKRPRYRLRSLFLAAVSAGVLSCGFMAAGGAAASASPAAPVPPVSPAAGYGGPQGTDSDPAPPAASLPPETSDQIMARAQNWYIQNYWVSRTDYWGDGKGDNPKPGWREDCSGFVSYTWGYWDSDGGFTTYDVMDFAKDISWSSLEPGDALLLSTGTEHMALFMKWDNAAHTEYNLMEESNSSTGTLIDKDVSTSNSYWSAFQPIQYDNYVLSPAGAASAPGVAVNPSTGNQYVFFRGGDYDVYEDWFTGSAWKGQDVCTTYKWGCNVASSPSVAITSNGSQYVFFQGGNGDIYEDWFTGGAWNNQDMCTSQGWGCGLN